MVSSRRERAKLEIDEYAEEKRQWLEVLLSKPESERRFSEQQQAEFVRRYFIEREKDAVQFLHMKGAEMTCDERIEWEADLQVHLAHYMGVSDELESLDVDELVEEVCIEKKLYISFSRLETKRFGSALARANAESYHRTLQRLRGKAETALYPEFQGISCATPLSVAASAVLPLQQVTPEQPTLTVGKLASIYMEEVEKANTRSKSTINTYRTIVRVIKELLGGVPTNDFTYEPAKEFLQSLLLLSPNLKKRFPKKTVKEVMEENERSGDFERLAKKTLENYLTNFSAILNFGVKRDYIRKNPLSDKFVREIITRIPEDPKEPILYTIEELNQLFRAPLYTGCVDDENGVNRLGSNRPRRGRFWMPLLALYHGFRLNEVAQLHTEDVKHEEGIWYIFVRPESDEKSQPATKQLKTEQSRRRVPIHPELKAVGFIEYVQERRKDTSTPLLFTDSARAKSGYYSDIASKRYATVRKAVIPDSLGTFHTFRHMFRDALRVARVESVEIVETLGGWEAQGSKSAQSRYGRGPSLSRLYEEISKVKYDGLDISHLYPKKN